ncbi:MAG: hypothetical protein Q4C72_00730 [Eubacteriales bacterium]|nr:hypothetical protein [Eubacteriales bacterium]
MNHMPFLSSKRFSRHFAKKILDSRTAGQLLDGLTNMHIKYMFDIYSHGCFLELLDSSRYHYRRGWKRGRYRRSYRRTRK